MRCEEMIVGALAVPGYGNRCRRWVRDSVRYLGVQDLATGGEHIPELSEVYVDIALASRSPGEQASEQRSLGELLARRPSGVIALIGQPGSGKTTLLAHAARRSAGGRGAGGLSASGWGAAGFLERRRFPVLLALREQAGAILADPEISLADVIRAGVGDGPGREPDGWWDRQLRRGRCLILLDGMDEVARADDRLTVAGWVERQIAAHTGNHFVITSRPYGLPDSLSAGADVFVVRPFAADQIQQFLDRWYVAAERHATGGSGWSAQRAVQLRARESAARLGTLLGRHPALRDLAANPLLLTMIAAAHRYRGALPGSRADLYGEICHVLLSRRGQAKDLPELLPWPARQSLLSALACQMMREHVVSLPAERVLEITGPVLRRFSASVTSETFLGDIARNGLFTEAAGGYSFTNLTFQEYLAARHVSANPELVPSLAASVDDPWWHETILLYAAISDASPIVRACLDSGTIPALTLAFDCADAGTEIDPDLRQRLEAERQRAFEPDCPADHRRLIAGVLATRLMHRPLTTAAGTRICARPVPADLYWLFLADTQAPQPDSPCDPRSGQPVTGAWGTQARVFVTWLNSITATVTGLALRLPRHTELADGAVASELDGQFPPSVTCVWTQPSPELRSPPEPGSSPAQEPSPALWLRPGRPHPHERSGAAIRQAIAADARGTAIVPQVLTAAVLDVFIAVIRDLDDIRALSGALAEDLAVRADSGGRAVDLMHAHARAIVLTYTHALGLARAEAITRVSALGIDVVSALDLDGARALADTIAGDLAGALVLARARAAELADVIEADLSILSAFDFDVEDAIQMAHVHEDGLARADLTARGAADGPDSDLARVFGLTTIGVPDPALPLPGLLGLPLHWVANGPLTSTLLRILAETMPPNPVVLSDPAALSDPAVLPGPPAEPDALPGAPFEAEPGRRPDLAARSLSGDLYRAFADALSSRAGLPETARVKAALHYSLTDALRELAATGSLADGAGNGARDENRLAALRRLADACAPMCDEHQPPDPADAAALRTVALALAAGISADTARTIQAPDARDVLLTVAATVTLVENRSKGEPAPGETVVLALA
jgi:hypothetical protein